MIVCICQVVRSKEIAEAIDEGARSVEEIGKACGAGTGCGRCRDLIHDMLEDAGVGCANHGGSCQDCPRRELPLAS